MRTSLEAIFMHGKKGTNINSIPAYNPNAAEVYADALNALNDVSFPLLEQIEACADQSFSYLEALLVIGVHESVLDEVGTSTNPAGAGATTQDVTPIDGVVTVESNEVLDGTAPHDNAATIVASAPSTLFVPTMTLFE
ncbi:hypothetical protein Tco_0009493 [Tanacetum coccineum]